MTLNRVALGALLACGGLLMPATQAGAQATNTRPAPAEPFAITDNSFFVEEAFNQERGIVQNIFTWARADGGGWDAGLTQEWPAPGMAHQLSYTLPLDGGSDGTHVGSVLLNYRFQALKEAPGHPAFSPRLSLILPTGRRDGTGDRPGLQMNLPFSKQVGDVYVHWNAGVTWLQGVLAGAQTTSLASPQIAGSLIWRARPMWHLMLESVVLFDDAVRGLASSRERSVLVSPGLRGGWNVGETQVVVGAAVPFTTAAGESSLALLTYVSVELPFTKNR